MINRILIRIKVIQILYSFLLVEKQFTLESSPSAPTKEKRFAYALYLDMLVLLVKVAESVERRVGDYPLVSTRFISRLLIDDTIKSLIRKYASEPFPYAGLVEPLAEKVKESGIYKKFLKESGNEIGSGEEHLWRDLFNLVILSDPQVGEVTARRTNYTLKGLERMHDMMNRTFINFLASQDNVAEVEQALSRSLDKARELYFRLLSLPVELTDLQDRIIDENRHKFLKNDEDINPDLRFVENRLVEALRQNETVDTFISKNKIAWAQEEPVMLRNLLKAVTDSEVYAEYMALPEVSVHDDAELWRSLFKKVILDNTDFLETLEEKSVFWNDDLETISTFVLKSFRRLEEGDSAGAVLEKFKDEEDARFGAELLRYLYRNKETYRRYIDDAVAGSNWDAERLAFMDIVVLETALAEILNFPKIPLSVSVNEYIELAKSYSSARSGAFVHGILGAVVVRLQKEGKLSKK